MTPPYCYIPAQVTPAALKGQGVTMPREFKNQFKVTRPCISEATKKRRRRRRRGAGGDARWKPPPTGNVSYMLNAEIPDSALNLAKQRADGCEQRSGSPSRLTIRQGQSLLLHASFSNESLLSSSPRQTQAEQCGAQIIGTRGTDVVIFFLKNPPKLPRVLV